MIDTRRTTGVHEMKNKVTDFPDEPLPPNVSLTYSNSSDERAYLDKPDTDDVYDEVSHPKHYTSSGMECIDEMILLYGEEVAMHFCLCNVHKYRKRALNKGGQTDLDKSDWYLAKYKELKNIVNKKKANRHDAFMSDMKKLLSGGANCSIDTIEFMDLYYNYCGLL